MYEEVRRKGRHLTEVERGTIAHLYHMGLTQTAIAQEMQVAQSTISRELRRGMVEQLDSETWESYYTYSPQKAQNHADYWKTAHGPDLKIGNNHAYLAALEKHILSGSSPSDALEKEKMNYPIRISKTTCYRYIRMGLFQIVRYEHLPQGTPKRKNVPRRRANVLNLHHRSIEKRAEEILRREEFGHWEMDSIIGKARGKGESCLVLTERKTRIEIVIKQHEKTAEGTVKSLRRLKRYFGKDWKIIFKTVTCDNGSEFSNQAAIEALGITMFYCHPNCPSERGSNEVANKLLRRKFPKGNSMASVTQKKAWEVQKWVNYYTRPMFGGKSSAEILKKELLSLPLSRRDKVFSFFALY